jgi:hypothetical protein
MMENPVMRERSRTGPVVSWQILGGLHHRMRGRLTAMEFCSSTSCGPAPVTG